MKTIKIPKVTSKTLCFKTPPLLGLWKNGKLIATGMEHCNKKKAHKGKHSWEG